MHGDDEQTGAIQDRPPKSHIWPHFWLHSVQHSMETECSSPLQSLSGLQTRSAEEGAQVDHAGLSTGLGARVDTMVTI